MEEATSSVSTLKMEEPNTSNFMVEKEGLINIYQSEWCHSQNESSLYWNCYENLKYNSQANNATSISSWVHKIASRPKFFRFFKIKIIANKKYAKNDNNTVFSHVFPPITPHYCKQNEDTRNKNKFVLQKKLLQLMWQFQMLLQKNA